MSQLPLPRPSHRPGWPRIAVLACALPIALMACGKPPVPEKERPPEPQAASEHTDLRDAIQAPIERAQQVEADVLEAADAQRGAIDAAAGG